MNQENFWRKLNPAVPRHWLFAIAASIWIGVGLFLCVRAMFWLAPFSWSTEAAFETISLLLALVGYFYGFSKIVRKNVDRIHALPERVCAFAFTPWRGYIMVASMVTLGIVLRNSSIPKVYLSVPYTAMGGMLLIGSERLISQFLAIAFLKR